MAEGLCFTLHLLRTEGPGSGCGGKHQGRPREHYVHAGSSASAAGHFYEREGPLRPARKSDSGYRLYTEEAIRRIEFIKHAQQCGFSLADIRELLELRSTDSACCDDIYRVSVQEKLQLEEYGVGRLPGEAGGAVVLVHGFCHFIVCCSASRSDTPLLAKRTGTPAWRHAMAPSG